MIPIGFAGISQGYQEAQDAMLKMALAQQHRAMEAQRLQAQIYHYTHPGRAGRPAGGDVYYPPISAGPTPTPGGALSPQGAAPAGGSAIGPAGFSEMMNPPTGVIPNMAAPSTMPPQPQGPSPGAAPPSATMGAPPAGPTVAPAPVGGAALTHQQLANEYNRQWLAGGTKAQLSRWEKARNREQHLADKEASAEQAKGRTAAQTEYHKMKHEEFEEGRKDRHEAAINRIQSQQTLAGMKIQVQIERGRDYDAINAQYIGNPKQRDEFLMEAKQRWDRIQASVDALGQGATPPPTAGTPAPTAPAPAALPSGKTKGGVSWSIEP